MLTWSVASCSIARAVSNSSCCDAESGGHAPVEPSARATLHQTRYPCLYSPRAPSRKRGGGAGGKGVRHRGQVSDTPFARNSARHDVQNEWLHGRLVGLRCGSRQIGQSGQSALPSSSSRSGKVERTRFIGGALQRIHW